MTELPNKMSDEDLIMRLLVDILGDRDDIYNKYRDINPNRGGEIRELLVAECIEKIQNLDHEMRERTKKAISNAIIIWNGEDQEYAWDSSLPPFDLGEDKSLLYRELYKLVAGQNFDYRES